MRPSRLGNMKKARRSQATMMEGASLGGARLRLCLPCLTLAMSPRLSSMPSGFGAAIEVIIWSEVCAM